MPGPAKRLDWRTLAAWHFEQPDRETFPALELGYEVARRGGTCGAVLNAANEAAVGRFLAGELALPRTSPGAAARSSTHHDYDPTPTLAEPAGRRPLGATGGSPLDPNPTADGKPVTAAPTDPAAGRRRRSRSPAGSGRTASSSLIVDRRHRRWSCSYLRPARTCCMAGGSGLGFVIFIHELGHFLAAKWCDVHVETFRIGFGPALPGCQLPVRRDDLQARP